MTDLYKWSNTAADNDDADSGITWAEFQQPDTVNNSARTMMKRVADWRDDLQPTRTSGGTGNAYTVTAKAAPATYASDFVVWFRADRNNTGSSTLTVNALAAKPLRAKTGTALASGDIQAGTVIGAYYSVSSDEFLIINSGYHFNALSGTIASSFAVGLQAGMVCDYFGSTLPPGFLWADGSAVSRTTYALLFAALGTTFGVGDGSTTFNLPDLRGRGTFGRDDMGGTAADRIASARSGIGGATLGAAGGADTVTIQRSDLPRVTVSVTIVDPGHFHSYQYRAAATNRGDGAVTAGTESTVTATTSIATTNISASFNLNGNVTQTAVNKMPPAIVCNKIVLALPALANASALGTNGVPYKFDATTTAGDPGAGFLRLNNAAFADATTLYISETGANSEGLASWLATLDDSTSVVRGQLRLYKIGAVSNFAIYNVTGGVVDEGTYRTLAITHVASTGSFSANDQLSVIFSRTGDKGDPGPSGGGLPWRWSADTSDTTPGSGDMKANNASLTAATELYVATTDSIGADETAWLDSLDDSTSTNKGLLQITETATPSNFVLYTVLSVTSATGYRKIGVSYLTGNGSFGAADSLSLLFSRTGNVGAAGPPGYVHPNHTGDVTSTGDGATVIATNAVTTAKIADSNVTTAKLATASVTFEKIQDVAANSIVARVGATSGVTSAVALSASQLMGRGSTGDLAPIALGSGLTMSGTTLSSSGGTGLPTGGTAGQTLVKNSATNGDASWADRSGWALISSATASSSASIEFTSGLDSTYDDYMLVMSGVVPATDQVYARLRVQVSGSYQTTNYTWGGQQLGPSGGAATGSTTDSITTAIALNRPSATLNLGNAAGEYFQAVIEFSNPDESAQKFSCFVRSHHTRADGIGSANVLMGQYSTAGAVTGLQITMSSGNITSGVFRLYGLRKT